MTTQTNSLQGYTPGPNPQIEGGDARYLQNELRKISAAISNMRAVMQLLEARFPDTQTYTFATLPTGVTEGRLAVVTDSTVTAYGATIAGSGANHVLARYTGSIWIVS